MKFNNYYNNEPSSFTFLKEKLDISIEEFKKSFDEKNIDAHSQIKKSNLYASRLDIFISDFLKRNKEEFLDCGCGLGFVARELNKLSDLNIDYCDPSDSIKKIHNKAFPKENFFQSDIENLEKREKKYDLIYLREVYPFTRDSNFKNQSELIKILNNKLHSNGLLIFEQIKNKKDLFDNLIKLNLKYKIIPLLPVRFGKKRILNKIFFKNYLLQILIKIAYKIFRKKINYFILIYKF